MTIFNCPSGIGNLLNENNSLKILEFKKTIKNGPTLTGRDLLKIGRKSTQLEKLIIEGKNVVDDINSCEKRTLETSFVTTLDAIQEFFNEIAVLGRIADLQLRNAFLISDKSLKEIKHFIETNLLPMIQSDFFSNSSIYINLLTPIANTELLENMILKREKHQEAVFVVFRIPYRCSFCLKKFNTDKEHDQHIEENHSHRKSADDISKSKFLADWGVQGALNFP